ncbi:MAG TPA: S53 family peptidase [Rhizomicrobium sp.]|nr:S53 family peptidase [Rhizomicrobium sp.]
MRNLIIGGLISAFAIACAAGGASAAQNGPVRYSEGVYFKPVCGPIKGRTASCLSYVVTDKQGRLLANSKAPVAGYGPSDLRDAYKIADSGNSSTVIAIVDAFGYDDAEADLAVYRSNFGLPDCTTDNGCFKKLNERGKEGHYPAQNLGWAQESALDLDMASAMCPNCQIWLVEADNNTLKHLAAAVNTAASLGAHVISNSYSGGDRPGTSTYEDAYTHPGVAITASTGDGGFGVGFPSTSPHVTAVGGTHLVRDSSARGWTETVWGGAGSGCSKFHDKPSWQTDQHCAHRMVSDVSAVADPATGVAVYAPTSSGPKWVVFGGTSVSAPLIGGIYGVNGGSVNFGSNPYEHPEALFDVTSGSNGSCGNGLPGWRKYYCTGEPGYDGPTGMGTPNGTAAFGD